MIARNECRSLPLAALLDDSLGDAEQTRLTDHLDRCDSCRSRLEEMAADQQWWTETKYSLAACTDLATLGPDRTAIHERSVATKSAPELRSSQHWVAALLEKPDRDNVLGMLDGITVYDVIGQGGMGVVLRGKDERLNRWLAIKLLSPMLASNGASRQRFFREAQAAASIVHPNIVPIYAVSAEEKIPYIVMPLVGGGSLEQRLIKDGPMPITQVLAFGLQVAEGLVAAHQQGIVHRDIKPANLLLDEGGFRVMLTDFGLARALDDASLTASGMVAGTPQYMSPEQAAGRSVDHRTDIYSLGAVMYALATGRPPITGSSTMEVLRKLGEQSPRPIAELNETYPRWFQRLIDLLMSRRVETRIATASEAAELLRGCVAHVRAPQKHPLPTSVRFKRNWGRFLVASAAVVGLIAAILAWQSTPVSKQPETQPLTQRIDSPIVTQSSRPVPTVDDWEGIQLETAIRNLELQMQQLTEGINQ